MIDFNITKKNASFSIINFEITEESLPLVKKLDEWTSAFVDGYQWMPSYRAGFSDGKTHLCKSTSDGFIVPNGLLKRIVIIISEVILKLKNLLRSMELIRNNYLLYAGSVG